MALEPLSEIRRSVRALKPLAVEGGGGTERRFPGPGKADRLKCVVCGSSMPPQTVSGVESEAARDFAGGL